MNLWNFAHPLAPVVSEPLGTFPGEPRLEVTTSTLNTFSYIPFLFWHQLRCNMSSSRLYILHNARDVAGYSSPQATGAS